MTAAVATVYLVDASPYIFRAFFALPDTFTAPDGRPVNAVYGFLGFLLKLVGDESPTHLGVAFDGSLTTSFRNDLYPPYKARRALPPADLEAQQGDCREVAAALGMATWVDDRYEADDLVATVWRRLRDAGHRVVVVSSDKDLAQLVDDDIELLDFARGERYGPRQVQEKLGVRPAQVPDLLGLAGDSVDNIPGVRGVGGKTARRLLAEIGSLEAILDDLDRVEALPLRGAAAVRRKLEEQRDTALLSKRLATVAFDAPATGSLEALRWEGADPERLDPVLERLGFTGVRDRVPLRTAV